MEIKENYTRISDVVIYGPFTQFMVVLFWDPKRLRVPQGSCCSTIGIPILEYSSGLESRGRSRLLLLLVSQSFNLERVAVDSAVLGVFLISKRSDGSGWILIKPLSKT